MFCLTPPPFSGGIDAVTWFQGELLKHAALRPLVLVLKYFILVRNHHITFQGGIGSFLLQLMVLAFLQVSYYIYVL